MRILAILPLLLASGCRISEQQGHLTRALTFHFDSGFGDAVTLAIVFPARLREVR